MRVAWPQGAGHNAEMTWFPRMPLLIAILLLVGPTAAGCAEVFERDVEVVREPPEFDSPRVTDLPVEEGLQILLDEGYDVVVVGRGTIILQELGFKGNVLEIKGDVGKKKRYCSPSLDGCVPIPRS